jgi:hypothetical protein
MMTQERLNVFEIPDNDLDLSGFTPKPADQPQPDLEKVRAGSEAARFTSRETQPATPTVLPRRLHHRRKTGRTAQLAQKVKPESLELLYALAEQNNWGLGETIEHGLQALERQLRGQGT